MRAPQLRSCHRGRSRGTLAWEAPTPPARPSPNLPHALPSPVGDETHAHDDVVQTGVSPSVCRSPTGGG
eukprot:11164445-Lingulodinium_polyedra.AAC.1